MSHKVYNRFAMYCTDWHKSDIAAWLCPTIDSPSTTRYNYKSIFGAL
jgi:hypothetical protein